MRAACAAHASVSFEWLAPPTTSPGRKPVIAVPGHTPRSPSMIDGPVLVTVVPAKTAKESAKPRSSGASAAAVPPGKRSATVKVNAPTIAAASFKTD
jgi:hypothetical protein